MTAGVTPGAGGAGSGRRVLHGIAVSPGIAIGDIATAEPNEVVVGEFLIEADGVDAEIDRFRAAVGAVIDEISGLRDAMVEELGAESAEIFDAQLMILSDPLAIDATETDIREHRRNAGYAFRQNVLRVLETFDRMQSGLFRERAADIRDVKRRVLRRLAEDDRDGLTVSAEDAIIVARELTPGDTVAVAGTSARGLATERGGATAHAAIMARARGLPAVFGIENLLDETAAGGRAILDGWRGRLILDPTDEDERRYERVRRHYAEMMDRLELSREMPSVTTDGREIHLLANIEMPLEIDAVHRYGASGVGLFRTEFLLMQRAHLASEDEQFAIYRRALELLSPKPVVIRTLDVGGDKFASYIGADREKNPFLGLRGIRYLLGHEDVFRAQLRAALRASAFGPVRLLFPMITTPEELDRVREHLDAVMQELTNAGVEFDRHVTIGIMIETPAAVLMADVLARSVDFFSIGSNDLTQYALAVDRTNAKLGYLFNPLHPSVLRAIHATVEAAHREGCRVSLCGELAADTLATVLLVGLGIDDLSMTPSLLPEVKQVIRTISYAESRDVATRAVRMSTAADVASLLGGFLADRFPELAAVRGL